MHHTTAADVRFVLDSFGAWIRYLMCGRTRPRRRRNGMRHALLNTSTFRDYERLCACVWSAFSLSHSTPMTECSRLFFIMHVSKLYVLVNLCISSVLSTYNTQSIIMLRFTESYVRDSCLVTAWPRFSQLELFKPTEKY